LGGLALLSAFRLPEVPGGAKASRGLGFWELVKQKKLILVLLAGTLVSVSHAFSLSYMPLLFAQSGGNVGLYGLSVFIMAGAEVPFLLLSGGLFRKYGTLNLVAVAVVAQALRCFAAFCFPIPAVLLATQAFHGLSFIVAYTAITRYVAGAVPGAQRATGQMLVSMAVLSAARVLGNLGGGLLSGWLGLRWAFLLMGGVALLGGVVWFFARRAANPKTGIRTA